MTNMYISGKMLAANAGRGFESHQGLNLFFAFTLFRMECEELFCKTNKTIKICICAHGNYAN